MALFPKHLESGDVVVLVEQNEIGQPPAGTVGTITELYSAMGGPAARVDWDCDNAKRYHNRALLKHLRIYDEPELNESDENLGVLFGGAVV